MADEVFLSVVHGKGVIGGKMERMQSTQAKNAGDRSYNFVLLHRCTELFFLFLVPVEYFDNSRNI